MNNTKKSFIPIILIILIFIISISIALLWHHPEEKLVSTSDGVYGNFAFTLPKGYEISNVTAQSCTIKASNDISVGGIILTNLDVENLIDSEDSALADYLNDIAWGSEYFSWNGDDQQSLIKYVSQITSTSESEEKKEYTRIFFKHGSSVYDMWFDMSLIDEDSISEFYPIVESK